LVSGYEILSGKKDPGRFKYPVPMKKSNLKRRLLHPLRLYF